MIPGIAVSANIELISQSVSTNGSSCYGGYSWDDPNETWYTWNKTGTTSVTVSQEGGVAASANIFAGSAEALLDATLGYDDVFPYVSGAKSSAKIEFRVIWASSLNLTAHLSATGTCGGTEITLFNQAHERIIQIYPGGYFLSGQMIYSGSPQATNLQNISIAIDPTQVYTLSAISKIGGNDAATVNVNISIPEPATMLILGIGILMIARMKKKFLN